MRFKEFLRESITALEVPHGHTGVEVADIQRVLNAIGYNVGPHGVDGIRGPDTKAAVKKFQADAGLTVDGDPGVETVGMLNNLIQQRPDFFRNLPKSTPADVKAQAAGDIDVSAIQDPDFNAKLKKVADALGIDPSALIAVMKHESRMNPAAVNPHSGATGLIQFMPKTAQSLGTTTDALRSMSAIDQLDYVYKYYKSVGVRPGMDAGDLYVATFMPAALGRDDSHVLGQRGAEGFSGKVYAQNTVLDRNRDGTITVGDIKNSVAQFA
jgi:peptidoglycan hydrolase-like protein with peptidoglycan-binding domain